MLWTNSSCSSAPPDQFIFSGYEEELSDVLPKWKKPEVEGRALSGSGFGEEKASGTFFPDFCLIEIEDGSSK